jgi:hypothetical protein
MMRKKIINKILLLFFSTSLIVSAQEADQVGTSMANFLKIDVGSRAASLGGAFVALANDASSTFWNPGGLVFVEKNEAMFQSTNWIANTKLYYLSVAVPLEDLGTLGASVYSLNSGDMEETTVNQPDGTGRFFNASDFALSLSYARSFTEQFSVGFTVKYITESLSREKASAFAFDIGSVFKTNILNGMRIGLALTNLGGTMKLEGPDLNVRHDINTGLPTNKFVDASLGTQEWQLPLLFRVGLGTYVIQNENTSLSVETAINDTRDFTTRYNVGSEFILNIVEEQKVALRLGYLGNYDEGGLTAGAGFYITLGGFNIKLDYAYADMNRLDNSQRYTLSILF